MDVTVLVPGDEERLRDLRLRSLQDAPDAFCAVYDEVVARPKASWESQILSLHTFVVSDTRGDLGVVRCQPDTHDPSNLWLLSLWVSPEARGEGLGDLLVTSVVDRAKSQRVQRVLLEVGAFNRPARRLYERCGFKYTGQRRRLPAPRDHIEELEMYCAC